MRSSCVVIAALVALAPVARADDPADTSGMTRDEAEATLRATEPDVKAAADAGLPVPSQTAQERAEAKSVLDAPRRRWSQTPRLGLAVSGGFPDLVTADLLFRPVRTIRLFAGPAWGYVAWGMNAGVLFEPWPGNVSPTLSLQVGELFQADASFLVKDGSGSASQGMKPLLQRVDYSYGSLDVGLELGSSDGFAFFLRVGLSYVSLKASGTAHYTTDSGTKVALSDPSIHGAFPSVKSGFQYFF